jgi:hypothetical protein
MRGKSMVSEAIGLPQLAASLVLLQRGAEEVHSARNTHALLAAGVYKIELEDQALSARRQASTEA